MRTSDKGRNLIKKWEGKALKAYLCPAGVWTIGYGWTIGVKKGDTWTDEKAETMLVEGLRTYEQAVANALGAVPTTQNQFDAMVALCYNIGPANFLRSSVLREHKAQNYLTAANAFLKWNKAGGRELPGLTNRRADERKLYLLP